MRAEPTQRITGPISLIPDALREHSVDPAQILAEFGLTESEFAEAKQLPFGNLAMLLERCAQATGQELFGLMLAARTSHKAFGLIGELMECAPTLGEAIADHVSAQSTLSTGASAYLIPYAETTAWGYGMYHFKLGVGRQTYDLAMGTACSIVRSLTQDAVKPLELLIQSGRPADPAGYLNIVKAPVRFDQQVNCLVLSKAAWKQPMANADPEKRSRIQKMIEGRKRSLGYRQKLRHEMRRQFALGDASLDAISASLEIHPRMLQRTLQQEGTSLEKELDSIRSAVAQELLELTRLQVSDVATALAYRSHTSFTHAFQRWTGLSPTAWRKERRTQ